MNEIIRKFIRTVLTNFTYLSDYKVFLKQTIQNTFKIPFEKDFNAIRLFPEIKDALYLDIGGHLGFAIDAIFMNSNKCKIYSFEPNPELFEKTKSRFRNNGRVEIYNWGLGNEEGEFNLYVPVYKGYVFNALGSFRRDSAISWLKNNRLYFYNEKYLEIREFKCKIKKLDNLELNPFFIKIDVQGHELPVLLGGEKTINNSKPIILIESPGDEIINLLNYSGYKLYRYNNKFILGEIGKLNSFFITDGKFQMLKKER